MKKMDDYQKTLAVINSCKTSRQNNCAYQMVMNFETMHKDDVLSNDLFLACDVNLMQLKEILKERVR